MISGLENPAHWLILAVILLVVMGPKRLPEIGRSLGHGMRGFKDSLDGNDTPPPAQVAPARDETTTTTPQPPPVA
jgi:sec-independent protein translocase protein TatA